MPSPRAALADIIKFKLDPNKPHTVNKKNLVKKSSDVKVLLSETSKDVFPNPEPVVESTDTSTEKVVSVVVEKEDVNTENHETTDNLVADKNQDDIVNQSVEIVETETSKSESNQAFQGYKKRSKKNSLI